MYLRTVMNLIGLNDLRAEGRIIPKELENFAVEDGVLEFFKRVLNLNLG